MSNDLFLVKRSKAGNNEAFVQLMMKKEKLLYNMARKFLKNEEDIADCLQETMMDAFKNIKSLKKDKYFDTWLCRILINNSNKIINKNNRILDYKAILHEEKNTSIDSLELRNLLLSLDSKYSVPLVLYYYNGYSIKEISEILDLPINTIKTRLARAKSRLKIQQFKEE
ncbi:RNA polymerase sigma factor [Enterococcus eurekensis]|uniref:RNA polymerase sigma factor n=2 Tax=Enterococcus TaxID=1350 RepID=A0ABV9M5B3_9ENTE|nr:sigma-70 family RNA polymerase sigma factor [Candidatus Enterococcus avicola]